MTTHSDHKKPQVDINQYLPEVYKSDVNKTVFDAAFNRLFTKPDTTRITGFIGTGNPDALINRQIAEPTPHRQAYQLAPTMCNRVGTVDTALSFKAFQQQLELMGVDMNRFDDWGSTTQFNFVPPVNIDMLVNYTDYFWAPGTSHAPAQYFTIENRCNKATSKVNAYKNILAQRGDTFAVTRINFRTNEFVVPNKLDDLFVAGFVFFTTDSSMAPLQNRFWTVAGSTFDASTNNTSITVVESFVTRGATPPTTTIIGTLWFDTTLGVLKMWSGSSWNQTAAAATLSISLSELATVYQSEANVVCTQSTGWDSSPWDDNQIGSVLWNTTLLVAISYPTEADWIDANNTTSSHPLSAPQARDLWYDTTNDQLMQRNITNSDWSVVAGNFSSILAVTKGTSPWDLALGADDQITTQWSQQNRWIHKSEVQSYTGIQRAAVPIIEYNSNMEMNEWVETKFAWKYRSAVGDAFVSTPTAPSVIELEPIKAFHAQLTAGKWTLYLFDKLSPVALNADYSDVFVPGFQFRITNDSTLSDVYTVATVTYREPLSTDHPAAIQSGSMITVVTIEESTFVSPTAGGTASNIRIEPQQTSRGDAWRGYHAHWVLDTSATTVVPVTSQSPTVLSRREKLLTPTTSAVSTGTLVVNRTYQELTISVPNVTTVALSSTLRYNAGSPRIYATGGDDVRVYINGVRQYGNYDHITQSTIQASTIIGNTAWATIPVVYITGIKFNAPLSLFDVVRIEVGPAAQSDAGKCAIPVRTVEDEDTFIAMAVTGQQPVYRSLTQFHRVEQVKTATNQYPMFNVYDVVTGDVVKSSNVFGFAESATAAIDVATQRRIVMSADGKEFEFQQSLLDVSDGILYGYRNVAGVQPAINYTPQAWWFNPTSGIVRGWDGDAWATDTIAYLPSGQIVLRSVVVSAIEPVSLANIDQALWYDNNSNVLYRRHTSTMTWIVVASNVIVGADPTLCTVWKRGTNNEQFVPKYVNASKDPVAIGSPDGDWQLPDQWSRNPQHNNRSNVTLSELVTHFSSILSGQPKIPGFLGGGLFTLTHDDYNYGVGGTIKEHNGSFDTLISAVNVSSVSPIGVIEFAQNEYASSLLFVRDLFSKAVVDLVSSHAPAALADLSGYVTSGVISRYQQNEFMTQVYNDTSAYDASTGVGVQNWIATAPMFGLSASFDPHVVINGGNVELFHHDGHRSRVEFSAAEEDRFARLIIGTIDGRTSLGKLGVVSASAPPASVAEFSTTFNDANPLAQIVPGVCWYTTGAHRILHKLSCYSVGDTAPAGHQLPIGTKYFNTAISGVFELTQTGWQQISTAGDISSLWVEINFKQLYAESIVSIEQQLYAASRDEQLVYDFSQLQSTLTRRSAYDALFRDRFNAFVTARNIKTPLVNTAYTTTNPFTWNYVASMVTDAPRAGAARTGACWQSLYTAWYNTPYPHVEPWCLQGFKSKPDWWDAEYLDATGVRMWKYVHATKTGMWENIRIGKIPAGRSYPTGAISSGGIASADGVQLPTYSYFSVNISDTTIPGGYAPDAILPPYYDGALVSAVPGVRSLFTSFAGQIVAPDADFAFGDMGPTEWQWTTSIQYVYDQSIIAFVMDPVKFMHAAFGTRHVHVGGLNVETTFGQVYTHSKALFHGDLYNTNQTYRARGLNQWYVNYNRYTGFDTNTQFRQEWSGWMPKLTYQFGGIVDTGSFDITNKYFDLNTQDYAVKLVNSGVIDDIWVDAFEVSILSMPASIVQYNNQSKWKFELNTLAAVPRSISYYGVKSYNGSIDVGSELLTVMQYSITGIDSSANRVYVAGDRSHELKAGRSIRTAANSTQYTIASSTYEPSTDRTRVVTHESVVAIASTDSIRLVGVDAGWVTGDQVVFSSTKNLPHPLVANTPYYLVYVESNEYKIAETYNDALVGSTITITSGGTGELTVAELSSSFKTYGGVGYSKDVWYHYALDLTDVRTITPPTTIYGMQTLINVIDGYVAFQKTSNVLYGVNESGEFDPDTGRTVDWQIEAERVIEWAFGLRASQMTISDRYGVAVDVGTNTLSFLDAVPGWSNGTQVTLTTSGSLPSPLISGSSYYIRHTDVVGQFQLAVTSSVFDNSNVVTLLNAGSGSLQVSLTNHKTTYPTFEVNPCRNSIWVDTPLGVVADVIEGPYADIRVQQTIFDQYGRPLKSDKLTVYRQDGRSRIAIRPQIANDLELSYTSDPYHYIHFGGAHLFVEGYEHFLVFNDYTTSKDLIHDAFLGLSATKFNLDYFENTTYTMRPSIGGFYMSNGQFNRNIENSIGDMRNFYDANSAAQNTDTSARARALVGYTGRSEHLDLLNINSKSQFMFYRGMLQTKGSVNSVNAFINSRRFVDAQMDEFWAWKIADFGDSRTRLYPEIKLRANDSTHDDIRLLFLSTTETADDDNFIDDAIKGFQPVSFSDSSRWVNFPQQRGDIVSPLFLDGEITSRTVVYSNIIAPEWADVETNEIDFWFNGTSMFRPVANGSWEFVSGKHKVAGNSVFWRHDGICDTARVIRRTIESTNQHRAMVAASNANNTFSAAGDLRNIATVGMQFQVSGSTNYDGVYTITHVGYANNQTKLTVAEQLTGNVVDGNLTFTHRDFANFSNVTLLEGTGTDGFTRVNSEVLRFDTSGFTGIVMIFTINPAKDRISPARLVDKRSHVKMHDIPLWHPALGHHYHLAQHSIDLISDTDPARYALTPNPSVVSQQPWNSLEEGKVWLDTSHLGYVPYYDDRVFTNVNDRLYNWGVLADWADTKVYRWVSTTTPPSQWDDKVTADAGNSAILQNDKASGTPKKSVFKRTRTSHVVTITEGVSSFVAQASTLVVGDQVLFTSTGTLPTPLEVGTKYNVASVSNNGSAQTITVADADTETVITMVTSGSGTIMMVPAFKADGWVRQSMIRERIHTAIAFNATAVIHSPIFDLSSDLWSAGDSVNVYKNGIFAFAGVVAASSGKLILDSDGFDLTLQASDICDVIRPIHTITADELAFAPDTDDDGATLIQWMSDYEYTMTTSSTGNLTSGIKKNQYYHYWVESSTTRNTKLPNSLSPYEIARQLINPPTPHFVVQRPMDDTTITEKYGYGLSSFGDAYNITAVGDHYYVNPVVYRQAILRNAASYITDDDRFVVRFAKDMALRDNLTPNANYAHPKNKHEEWFLFRKEQPSTIPEQLWLKLTESMMGQLIAAQLDVGNLIGGTGYVDGVHEAVIMTGGSGTGLMTTVTVSGGSVISVVVMSHGSGYVVGDVLSAALPTTGIPFSVDVVSITTTRVPSLERELYDSLNGTDTRFGLGVDQTFADRAMSVNTVVSYLQTPTNDFYPADIDDFFLRHTFKDASSIKRAMDEIYSTFPASHVNAMWFAVLADALSTKSQYRELMKTSWIALHGIRVLEVGGMFDD